MSALLKHRTVLMAEDSFGSYSAGVEDTHPAIEGYDGTGVQVREDVFRELGSPAFITVTIEPGDRLNESVCLVDGEGDLWAQAPNGCFYLPTPWAQPDQACVELDDIVRDYGIYRGASLEPTPDDFDEPEQSDAADNCEEGRDQTEPDMLGTVIALAALRASLITAGFTSEQAFELILQAQRGA